MLPEDGNRRPHKNGRDLPVRIRCGKSYQAIIGVRDFVTAKIDDPTCCSIYYERGKITIEQTYIRVKGKKHSFIKGLK